VRSVFITTADGVRLPFDWYPTDGPERAALLVIHGYADHGLRYRAVAERFASEGFAVATYDFRGHGRAEGQRGHCQSFDEYLTDLECALAAVRATDPQAPICLLGQSLGSLIALRYLSSSERESGQVFAAILTSPYIALAMPVSPIKVALARLLSGPFPRLTMSNGLRGEVISSDSNLGRDFDSDPLVHHAATARWFTETAAAQGAILDAVGRLSVPTLWLAGDADRIADVAATRAAYARAGGSKRLIVYDGRSHELWNEADGDAVFRDALRWLDGELREGGMPASPG